MSRMSEKDIEAQNANPDRAFKSPTLTKHGKILVLKSFREKHKWNKTQAAHIMGYVSPGSWLDYESGRTPVPGQLLRHIEHYNALHKLIYANNNQS